MAKDKLKYPEDEDGAAPPKRHHRKSKSESEPDPDSDSESDQGKRSKYKKSKTRKSSSKRRRSTESDSYSSSSSEYDEDSYDSEYSDSEEEERRRRRRERKRREEKKERRRREKEKDKKRKRKEEKKKKGKKDKKREKDKGKKGAVTNLWGKYGIIRETDMWNKRPEFTAWLLEVKKVNLESLPNWEEKQLFKEYYNLDAYYQRQMEKEMKKGFSKVVDSERTVFNDEEQRRLELQRERERQREEQVEALKCEMQSGMAQAMKEQAQLREEMAYQYKLGNFEAAASIQRRLDPDVAM
ncbi:hypothetical protein BUALT_Bualt03G0135800 [Buddleja alternifolia]|uniref:Uncharacterized protein n=1 Tax=Buddleja alternifolia TaxID=168488 RepID=A0AAV6Y0B3_9LAMI|nr:hypothetical protein BUALT_Bualt03G0135800 [Buddleja alternifolia]